MSAFQQDTAGARNISCFPQIFLFRSPVDNRTNPLDAAPNRKSIGRWNSGLIWKADPLPLKASELGALAVSRLTKPGFHAVGGVNGLYLQVLPTGARTWVLRAHIGGKRRHMGLGSFGDVTLAGARESARRARDVIRDGKDPIDERKARQLALRVGDAKAAADALKLMTFDDAMLECIKAKEAEWKNEKHSQQWINTLKTYASPVIGILSVADIEVAHVLRVLEPIWKTKTETAQRVRGRIERVLNWATTRELRQGPNPARWRGHLDNQLAAPSKIAKVRHHAAVAIDDMPDFMVRLRASKSIIAQALDFLIMTAGRSGEVRGATWSEIDVANMVWTIPGSRMKAGKEHRVALSPAAVDLLGKVTRHAGGNLVFPSVRRGQLSDAVFTKLLKDWGVPATAHGFRSTFSTWASERTGHSTAAVEQALAHTIENKVEAAYRRGDMFDKRRALMADWAAFIGRPKAKGNVVSLDAARA